MTRFQLVVPGKPFTQNDERRASHWTVVRNRKRAVESAVYAAIAEQHGHYSQLRKIPFVWPVNILIEDHCRTANLRDPEACSPSVKVIKDTLTDVGLWPDDNTTYVANTTYASPTKTGVDELVITITDLHQIKETLDV